MLSSLHCKEIRIPDPVKFLLVNPESWALESGIQLKESRIQLPVGIWNSSSTDNKSGIQNPQRRIQNPRTFLYASY